MYRGQHQNPESAPLLANNAVNNAAQERDDNNGCAKRCSLFSFFCFLSGQYINIDTTGERPSRCNIISIAGFIIFLGQFVLHYGHLVIATIVEVFRIGNMSYTVAGDDYDAKSRALQAVLGARNCSRQVPFNHGNSVEDSFLLLAMPDFVLANWQLLSSSRRLGASASSVMSKN